MNQEYGERNTTALAKYQGLTSLTKEQANEVLIKLWPKATGAELFKAMSICVQYGLNPLMRHLYMIPFKEGGGEAKLVCVMGIGANRLIASRKHQYSYVDDTPRMMTEAEEIRRYGEVDRTKFRAMTKLKDVKSGAEASGYGEWPRNNEPYGLDKGNSKANMAFIRSERQALDKLYPADMPSSEIPVVDENYIEGEARVIEEQTGEITGGNGEAQPIEHFCTIHNTAFTEHTGKDGKSKWYSHRLQGGQWCNEAIKEEPSPEQPAQEEESLNPPPEPETPLRSKGEYAEKPKDEAEPLNTINMADLKDQLAELKKKAPKTWGDANLVAYMKKSYGLAEGTVPLEMAKKLDQPKATHFMAKVQEALDMA